MAEGALEKITLTINSLKALSRSEKFVVFNWFCSVISLADDGEPVVQHEVNADLLQEVGHNGMIEDVNVTEQRHLAEASIVGPASENLAEEREPQYPSIEKPRRQAEPETSSKYGYSVQEKVRKHQVRMTAEGDVSSFPSQWVPKKTSTPVTEYDHLKSPVSNYYASFTFPPEASSDSQERKDSHEEITRQSCHTGVKLSAAGDLPPVASRVASPEPDQISLGMDAPLKDTRSQFQNIMQRHLDNQSHDPAVAESISQLITDEQSRSQRSRTSDVSDIYFPTDDIANHIRLSNTQPSPRISREKQSSVFRTAEEQTTKGLPKTQRRIRRRKRVAQPRRRVWRSPVSSISNYSDDRSWRFHCSECGERVYEHNREFHQRHMKSIFNFRCSWCKRGFIWNQSRIRHCILFH